MTLLFSHGRLCLRVKNRPVPGRVNYASISILQRSRHSRFVSLSSQITKMPPRLLVRFTGDVAALQQVLQQVPQHWINTDNSLKDTTRGVNALYDYLCKS